MAQCSRSVDVTVIDLYAKILIQVNLCQGRFSLIE